MLIQCLYICSSLTFFVTFQSQNTVLEGPMVYPGIVFLHNLKSTFGFCTKKFLSLLWVNQDQVQGSLRNSWSLYSFLVSLFMIIVWFTIIIYFIFHYLWVFYCLALSQSTHIFTSFRNSLSKSGYIASVKILPFCFTRINTDIGVWDFFPPPS